MRPVLTKPLIQDLVIRRMELVEWLPPGQAAGMLSYSFKETLAARLATGVAGR